MKTTPKFAGLIILGASLALAGCSKENTSKTSLWKTIQDPAVTSQLQSFLAEKQAQADSASSETLPGFPAFMAAAKRGDHAAVKKLGEDLDKQIQKSYSDPRWHGPKMQAVKEIIGTFDAFGNGSEKYVSQYGNEIIQSIPPGSIYFGGTDPGRFVITAMQKSFVDGDPFFTLTQNAMADGTYLDYLHSMYGNQIYTPTTEDSQKCFEDYTRDVQQRMQKHQLKPGENVTTDTSGHVQVSGYIAVMEINGLMVKKIFDKNPTKQFFVEESYPLDWMYPYLEPHGLIFKLNNQPLTQLSDESIQQDHDYWTKTISPMIGDWLNADTSISDIAAANEKVFLQHDFSGFTGDTNFVLNTYSHRMFSKERSSIGGLYDWRAGHASSDAEKQRMSKEADFAYRQSWALCPYSPDVVFRYVNLLMGEHRNSDALLVAESAEKFGDSNPESKAQFDQLVKSLKNSH